MNRLERVFVAAGVLSLSSMPLAAQRALPSHRVPAAQVQRVVPNDNLVAAGRKSGTTVTVNLVAQPGEWRPDGDDAPAVVVPAFAVEGGAPQIPGPLVRVAAGTTILVTVRNALGADTLRVYGIHARPLRSADDSVPLVLAPNAERTVRFTLDVEGTFYYWGTTTHRALAYRTGLDGQLTGAIVVDPPNAPPPSDRIFVIGSWTDTVARSFLPRHRVLGVVNGRSWPATERVRATVGDSVRWRVINASGDLHPMHLHGFFFRVTARGDGTTDTLFTPDRAPMEVTEAANMGATYAMTWVPERAGNWLFHCHIPEHFGPRAALGLPPDSAPSSGHGAHRSHAEGGMSGLVLGVNVRERGGRTAKREEPDDAGRRHLRLLVRANVGSTQARPLFSYAVHETGVEPPMDSGLRTSPHLVLTRGVPVHITVVNRLSEPTAVHWHGIELESYFDGVPDFSGDARRISPMIAPGDSFVVRFTPPRSGTFIYHTHHDENRQQNAGLAGALIVLEPGQQFDPAVDHVLMVSSPFDFTEATRFVLFNGAETPAPITLRVGEPARCVVMLITRSRAGPRIRLFRGDSLIAWRALAKDAAEVPPALRQPRAVARLIAIGETLDLEILPTDTTTLRLEMRVGPQPDAQRLGVQMFRVRGEP
jgi:manganese oxidase